MIYSLSNRKSYGCLKKFTYFNQASLGLISDSSSKKMTNFAFLKKISEISGEITSFVSENRLENKENLIFSWVI